MTWKKVPCRVSDLPLSRGLLAKKKNQQTAGHQKTHEWICFSHSSHKGYKCIETCMMNVAELSPVWHLYHEFNGEDRKQYGCISLILENTLNILEHSSPLRNLKTSWFQCRLSHEHRWKHKSTGRRNVQPTQLAAFFKNWKCTPVESTVLMVELFHLNHSFLQICNTFLVSLTTGSEVTAAPLFSTPALWCLCASFLCSSIHLHVWEWQSPMPGDVSAI